MFSQEKAYIQALNWVKTIGDETAAARNTQPVAAGTKSDHRDLITEYDTNAEQYLIAQIQKHYPSHRILGEETQTAGTGETFTDLAGPVWIIDPIDGTMNFVRQGRDWGVMLAHYQDGKAQFAAIYDPVRDELHSFIAGCGAFKNSKQLPPLKPVTLKDSLVIVEGGLVRDQDPLTIAILERCLSGRMIGSSAIVTGSMANGGCAAFLSRKQMPWDAAAPKAILEELGAVFTQPDGTPLTLLKGEPCLMASPGIHQEILELAAGL